MIKQRTHTRLERQKAPETSWSEQPSTINTPGASVHEVLATEGQSLDSEIRSFMEPRFGHDFSQVRIHADEQAAESAQAVGAQAYTVGSDVVFGPGQYTPETHDGRSLLAHELTHVVQQRNTGEEDTLTVGPTNDSYEQEANTISESTVQRASDTTTNNTETNITSIDTSSLVQRTPDTGVTQADLAAVQQKQDIIKKQLTATQFDQYLSHKFQERLASYRQTIYVFSGGLNTARNAFQAAKMAQDKTDELQRQIFAIVLSAGVGWVAGAALGALEPFLEKATEAIKDVGQDLAKDFAELAVEKSSGNEAAMSSELDPMTVLTGNLAKLEAQSQEIEKAFITRSETKNKFTDNDWKNYNNEAEQTHYQEFFDKLTSTFLGVESLKPSEEVARILEWHMWARWIRGQGEEELELREEAAKRMGAESSAGGEPGPRDDTPNKENKQQEGADNQPGVGSSAGGDSVPPYDTPEVELTYDVGTDMEAGLNKAKVSGQAGVTLTESFWHANSPDNWRSMLLTWAEGYKESILR